MQHYQVTLTTANTIYSLLTLVKAVNAAYRDVASQIWISPDDGNTVACFLGGPAVTTAVYGVKLYPEDITDESLPIRPFPLPPGLGLGGLYAVTGTNAQILNILVL